MLRLNRHIDNIRDNFNERRIAYYQIEDNLPIKKVKNN